MSCSPRWRTERTLLRRFVNADTGALAAAIFAEAEVMKTLIGDASTAERQHALAAEWIARWEAAWDEHGYGVWAVEIADPALGAPGTLIGFSGFEAPVLPGEGPELIAGRGSAWWSRGISTELGHAVVEHLFAHTDQMSVHALVFYDINPAATRMMEKLGFSPAGAVPIHARVGPSYQAETLRFELGRVSLAAPGRELATLDIAAFKVGQLLGSRAADPDGLRCEALGLGPAEPVESGWRDGLAAPLLAEDYRALGNAWLDHTVAKALGRISRAADPASVQRAARELGSIAAAVARDIAAARATLHDQAVARGLDPAATRDRIAARLADGLRHPTMLLFRRQRSDHARA